MTDEGYGFSLRHAYLLLDGSGSMRDPEVSHQPKHLAVAHMVQRIIDLAHDRFTDTFLTIMAYDSDGSGRARVTEPLVSYDVADTVYKGNTDLNLWDPLRQHGGGTPIGSVLAYAREKAEAWVDQASGQEQRRAVIFLLSDGMNNVGPDGMTERQKIEEFNQKTNKGMVRLATVGYFQHPEGQNSEEDSGRRLLKSLPTNARAHFEANSAERILEYILATVTVLG